MEETCSRFKENVAKICMTSQASYHPGNLLQATHPRVPAQFINPPPDLQANKQFYVTERNCHKIISYLLALVHLLLHLCRHIPKLLLCISSRMFHPLHLGNWLGARSQVRHYL